MVRLPMQRMSAEAILTRMRALREHDAKWQEGKAWSLVYHVDDEATDLLKAAYTMFFSENGLNPMSFPSLKRLEAEVVSRTANLLGGDEGVVGNMTSGGTESISMTVKTARDWARTTRPAVTSPEMVLPVTAHPALERWLNSASLSSRCCTAMSTQP
jgi:sphinganine-1-phosphate aldolase